MTLTSPPHTTKSLDGGTIFFAQGQGHAQPLYRNVQYLKYLTSFSDTLYQFRWWALRPLDPSPQQNLVIGIADRPSINDLEMRPLVCVGFAGEHG